jgi:hypothetical protein
MSARTSPSRVIGASILAFALTLHAWADDESAGKDQVSIDELRSPTSPAFTILGVAPTNVVRPNTPRELAVELLSAKDRGDGDLPTDLALEVSPYWLMDHPDLTFSEYYNNKSVAKTILRSLSVSVATTKIPDETIEGTTLGVGVRFLLLAGEKAPGLDGKVKALQGIQDEMLDCIPDMPDDATASPPASTCSEEEIAKIEARMRKAGAEIRDLNLQRPGWVVEAAFGSSRDYPDSDGASSSARLTGAWITASYKISDPSELTLLTVARLLEDRSGVTKTRMKDIGGRFIYEPSHMPVSLSLEVLHRDIENGDNSTSVLGVLEYPINDTLRLVASYGRGVATPTQDSDLQATISVNFGFGKGPSVSINNLK